MTPPEEEDLLLMRRLTEGEDSVLRELMRRWKLPVIRFAYRYLNNTADAHEVAAETFVKVHRHRDRFRPERAKFSTWLFAIAANEAKMRLRWRRRHPESLQEDLSIIDLTEGEGRTPSSELELNELGSAIHNATGKLPHELRATFLLYHLEGFSYREVAGALKCSEKAVERRLAKARSNLRIHLQEHWEAQMLESE